MGRNWPQSTEDIHWNEAVPYPVDTEGYDCALVNSNISSYHENDQSGDLTYMSKILIYIFFFMSDKELKAKFFLLLS